MGKELIHSFGIKLASSTKTKRFSNTYKRIGKVREAEVQLINGELRAFTSPVEEMCDDDASITLEYVALPFTPKSLELKGKTNVFLKGRDEHGKRVCVIRSAFKANTSPGIEDQYDALIPGLLISGHIVSNNGKHYFEYENLLAYTAKGAKIDKTSIDDVINLEMK